VTALAIQLIRRCAFDRIVRLIASRLFEWVSSFMMLGIGVHLMLWPNAVRGNAFAFLLHYIPAEAMSLFFWLLAISRISALIINGHAPRLGPIVRGCASGMASIIWGQMAVTLYVLNAAGDGAPSSGIPIYSVLMLAELFSVYRASSDVRV
jgi:hypothetical protein